ncbi:hypothetical protein [Amycolatopsis minnesotensis]|uniref:Uncharacterized protein n=1 Tax=Amycolatopsis minnesotensis TaxID=337894 RepID=A0ABN2QWX5_9PSEU
MDTSHLAEAQLTLRLTILDATHAVFPASCTVHGAHTILDQTPLPPSPAPHGHLMTCGAWIDGVDRTRTDDYFDSLKTWWTEHGWTDITDDRPTGPVIAASSSACRVTVEATPAGRIALTASTSITYEAAPFSVPDIATMTHAPRTRETRRRQLGRRFWKKKN